MVKSAIYRMVIVLVDHLLAQIIENNIFRDESQVFVGHVTGMGITKNACTVINVELCYHLCKRFILPKNNVLQNAI